MEYVGRISNLSKSISWMLDEVKCKQKSSRCVAQRARALEELVQAIVHTGNTSGTVSRALQDLYLTLNMAHDLVKDCTKTRVPPNPLKLKRDFKSVNKQLNNAFQVLSVALEVHQGSSVGSVFDSWELDDDDDDDEWDGTMALYGAAAPQRTMPTAAFYAARMVVEDGNILVDETYFIQQ